MKSHIIISVIIEASTLYNLDVLSGFSTLSKYYVIIALFCHGGAGLIRSIYVIHGLAMAHGSIAQKIAIKSMKYGCHLEKQVWKVAVVCDINQVLDV